MTAQLENQHSSKTESIQKENSDNKPNQSVNHGTYVYMATFVSAIGGFLLGYDTAIVSGALIYIRTQLHLNDLWQELIVSVTLLSAWFASSVASIATEKLGRKPVISSSAMLLIVASLMMALASDKYILFGGRLVAGLGIGAVSMSVPMYIAEIAPSEIRGRLGIMNCVCITGGQFIASLIAYGASFLGPEIGWRVMLGMAALPAIIQYFALQKMPESPRWLMSKLRDDEARVVLRKTRALNADIEVEFGSIRSDHLSSKHKKETLRVLHGKQSVFKRIMQDVAVRRALLAGCLLHFVQQATGINTIMYYSATIFQMAGINSKSNALLLASLTAGFNFIFSLVGMALIDQFGRRKILLPSLYGVFCGLMVLGLSFQLGNVLSPRIEQTNNSTLNENCSKYRTCSSCVEATQCGYCFSSLGAYSSCLTLNPADHTQSNFGECNNKSGFQLQTSPFIWAQEWCPSSYSSLTLIALLLFHFMHAIGIGNLTWTINSEIYPSWARDRCQSIATSVNWMTNLLISMTFLSLTRVISKHAIFYVYAAIALLGGIYFAFTLPETRGKTLEQVQDCFTCSSKSNGKSKEKTNIEDDIEMKNFYSKV